MINVSVKDYEDIIVVMNKYIEGAEKGDIELLKEAFHERCTITGYLNGKLDILSMEDFYSLIQSVGPSKDNNYRAKADVMAIEDTTAVAHVIMEGWHGMKFSDHHSLIKENGDWKIIAKVYQQFE